tara:strand:- start:454 stop:840 length:387 start_codon:yes stop_codon:yes gene_type:complete
MAKTGRDTRDIVKRTKRGVELLKEFSGAARKLHPGFDKLSKQDKRAIVTKLSLQRYNPEDPEYSNENIRNAILSGLGVASGKYDEYTTVDRDSAGRTKTLKEQKEQNPAGFAIGGMVHRGRKAMRGAD